MTHTPAQTAEQRARAAALQIVPPFHSSSLEDTLAEYDRVSALIASAITQAEDAAYERAISMFEEEARFYEYDQDGVAVDRVVASASERIRTTLKSQKETP